MFLAFSSWTSPTGNAKVVRQLSGTFIQLLDEHRFWTSERWDQLFGYFRELHLNELIVQWVVSDRVAFYPSKVFESSGNDSVAMLLSRADDAGMRVLLGLARTNDYWSRVEGDPKEVRQYLEKLRGESITAAAELAPVVRSHRSFAGWYITEEIDDINWRKQDARDLLITHMTDLTSRLRALTPNATVSVSMFSQARSSPAAFAEFWQTFLKQTKVDRLLFQDGIGVGKLDLPEVEVYLTALKEAGLASSVDPVIELFKQTSGPPIDDHEFKAAPATIERIKDQIHVESRLTSASVIGFSVPEYMTPLGGEAARELYREYLAELQLSR